MRTTLPVISPLQQPEQQQQTGSLWRFCHNILHPTQWWYGTPITARTTDAPPAYGNESPVLVPVQAPPSYGDIFPEPSAPSATEVTQIATPSAPPYAIFLQSPTVASSSSTTPATVSSATLKTASTSLQAAASAPSASASTTLPASSSTVITSEALDALEAECQPAKWQLPSANDYEGLTGAGSAEKDPKLQATFIILKKWRQAIEMYRGENREFREYKFDTRIRAFSGNLSRYLADHEVDGWLPILAATGKSILGIKCEIAAIYLEETHGIVTFDPEYRSKFAEKSSR